MIMNDVGADERGDRPEELRRFVAVMTCARVPAHHHYQCRDHARNYLVLGLLFLDTRIESLRYPKRHDERLGIALLVRSFVSNPSRASS